MVTGVDGWQKGWVGVSLTAEGQFAAAAVDASLENLLSRLGAARAVGVDMPLHLADSARREADMSARAFLGGLRGRSVFAAPPAFILERAWLGKSHHEVNREMRQRYGHGLSKQAFALCPKVVQVNTLHGNGIPLAEVHPEVSFSLMNDGKPLRFPKKSWGGQQERLALLERVGIRIPGTLPAEVATVPADDLLDACAAAWSAHRLAHGKARRFPEEESGLDAIWA